MARHQLTGKREGIERRPFARQRLGSTNEHPLRHPLHALSFALQLNFISALPADRECRFAQFAAKHALMFLFDETFGIRQTRRTRTNLDLAYDQANQQAEK
jgi:hypothetical protein